MTPSPDHLTEVHKADRAYIKRYRIGLAVFIGLSVLMAGVLAL